MKQQFEKMMKMVTQALQGSNVNNSNTSQATAVSNNSQDIIILGGWYGPGRDKVSNTVEQFNAVEGKSTELPRMNHPRVESASCVYNGDVIVAGGFDGQDGTDSIEILKMNQHPLRWTMFGGKLPVKLSRHIVKVYQDKIIVIGGYNWDEEKTSDVIYELALAPRYTSKTLARMPQPRESHGAEIVNGKLFILGGATTISTETAINTVVVYDFIMNKFKRYLPLPKPTWGMSTVTWGDMIIVIGGAEKNYHGLNDVIMYDTETGRSERLPSLKHKRNGPSAVIMHDVIVVLRGHNEQGYLNSVETFTIGSDRWIELPGMKEKRSSATAVVKPRN